MKSLVIDPANGFGLAPLCVAALKSPGLVSFHEEKDRAHPLAVFNHAWSRYLRKFDLMLDAMESVSEGPTDSSEGVLEALSELYYRSAEVVDVLTGEVAAALSPGKRNANIAGSRSLETALMHPCNKLKHNGNRLAFCTMRDRWFVVFGARMMHVRKGVLVANPEFHRKRDCLSLNTELRRIYVDLTLYGDEVGRKIADLGGGVSSDLEPAEHDVKIAKRMATLPTLAWWDETEHHMPLVKYENGVLEIARKGGTVFPLGRAGTKFSVQVKADGVTKGYAVDGRIHK